MGRLKLLIAEGTEELRIALTDVLRGIYQIRECGEGNQALQMMQSFRPDLVVLDMMLPGLDGITLLQRAVAADLHPMVLVTTRFQNDYILESIQALGVGYIVMKPYDVGAVAARLGDLRQRIHPAVGFRQDAGSYVSNMLLALGVPVRLKGYGYLREAVVIMAKNPGQSITKELYPAVAAAFRTENARVDRDRVERCIRNAIAIAWKKRDPQVWGLYFPNQEDGSGRGPTNGDFIARLAEALTSERENM